MAMLKHIDKELSMNDKELSLSVYLESSHDTIEQYKDDILCLMFDLISCDKGTIKYIVKGYVGLMTSHNLGSHNILLEVNYDL